MALNVHRQQPKSNDECSNAPVGLDLLCYICNSLVTTVNGYNTYLTTVGNGKLLSDVIKKLPELNTGTDILDPISYLCSRCFLLFNELELVETRCYELKKTILDSYVNKSLLKHDVSEQNDILILKSQGSNIDLHYTSSQENHDQPLTNMEGKIEIDPKIAHTEEEDKELTAKVPYKCKICGKTWQKARQLKVHERIHNCLGPFICEICGHVYKRKQALKIHIDMHEGINPFSCHVCGKVFTQKGALQRHIPIHTGETPFQCEMCGKRFIHHTSFNIHILAHTGVKTHTCEVCGMKLTSGSHLKRHSRIHTGERPYACSFCNRRFAEKYNLMSHMKTHTNDQKNLDSRKLHACQVCGLSFVRKSKLEDHLSVCHSKIVALPKNSWMPENINQERVEPDGAEIQLTTLTSMVTLTTANLDY